MKRLIPTLFIFYTSFIPLINASFNLDEVKRKYDSLMDKKYILLPHEGSFLLPVSYSNRPNQVPYQVLTAESDASQKGKYNKNLEAEFQISFMLLAARNIFGTDLNFFGAYTQQSWWQVYNEGWSRQFRETNYAPEIFARKVFTNPRSFIGGKFIAYDIGLIHQSNGQSQRLSRSWNRAYLRFSLLFGRTFIKTTLWYRIADPSDRDDNPDLYKYLGYGSISLDHLFDKSRVQLRYIPGTKYQGVELGYSYPFREGLRFYAKIGYGYGLSMIDYNHHSEKAGVGVILTDILSD